jgi:1-acyl-sn-glycerol-3-phosphate acyltransferase
MTNNVHPAWRNQQKMSFFYRSMNFFSWYLFRLLFPFKIYGQDHIKKGAAIIAANHVSFLDPPLLGIACPEPVHYMAKDSLFKIPLFGFLIRKMNAHPLKGDGNDVGVMKVALKVLQDGNKIILFPEGKRSFDNTLSPIKPGLFLLFSKTEATVIPTYIFGTYEAWPRKSIFPRFRRPIGCVFGSGLDLPDFSKIDKKQAQHLFAEKLTHALENLKLWVEKGALGNPP